MVQTSRKQRMLEYARLRTPIWRPTGKAMLRVLTRVVEENQPTPQVSFSEQDDGSVVCEWLVSGRSVVLWVFEVDGEILYEVEQDNDDADCGHGEDVMPAELVFESEDKMVDWLRETLTELGKGVKNPLV